MEQKKKASGTIAKTCTVGLFFSDFVLGWLAPLTCLLLELCVLLFRETPILAREIGVARVVVGAVLLLFSVSSNFESVNSLVTRLGFSAKRFFLHALYGI